jgi:hypothetical protein
MEIAMTRQYFKKCHICHISHITLRIYSWAGVRLNPHGTGATIDELYQPLMMRGAIIGLRIGRGTEVLGENPIATLSTTNSI